MPDIESPDELAAFQECYAALPSGLDPEPRMTFLAGWLAGTAWQKQRSRMPDGGRVPVRILKGRFHGG